MTSRRRKTIPPMRRGRAGVTMAIATLACGGLTACGSSSQVAKVAPRTSPIKGVSVASQACAGADKTGIKLVGTEVKAPKSMTAAQLDTILRACGFARSSAKSGPRPGAKARTTSSSSGTRMVAQFAACMRQHGVNVPAPTPARSDPQLETRGINTRSRSVRAASARCSHYLRLNTSSG